MRGKETDDSSRGIRNIENERENAGEYFTNVTYFKRFNLTLRILQKARANKRSRE